METTLHKTRGIALTLKNFTGQSKSICFTTLISILFCTLHDQVIGQSASATWSLTSTASVSCTGSVTATNQSSGSGINTIAYNATDGVNSRGWDSPSQDANDYYQFTISPQSGNSLIVTNISTLNNVSASTGSVLIQYSFNSSFTSPQPIGSTYTVTTTQNSYSFSPTINVNNGQTLYIRMFAWKLQNANRTFNCKNFNISGT
ncbi:MAG TPA: hypothetical protein VII99_04610, partial [Bacteroidia bacterium]